MDQHNQLIEQLYEHLAVFKRAMMGSRDQLLGELQLTRTQIEVIMRLGETDSQTVGDLAACLAVTHSAATQTIETLVKRGLIERLADDHDRRIVRTRLSAAGKQLATGLHASRLERMNEVFGSLADDDLRLMISVIVKLTGQFERRATKPKEMTDAL